MTQPVINDIVDLLPRLAAGEAPLTRTESTKLSAILHMFWVALVVVPQNEWHHALRTAVTLARETA